MNERMLSEFEHVELIKFSDHDHSILTSFGSRVILLDDPRNDWALEKLREIRMLYLSRSRRRTSDLPHLQASKIDSCPSSTT